ncbi:MAG: flavin reductase family protein [Gemmatimonadetes bacterium]|nr:flavin reductase family protein [Gemmatimonadota bacterium]
MPIDADRFRLAMGHLVAGVSVVAARAAEGRVLGMTASAVASLSLEPPMLLVCVDRSAEIHDTLVSAPLFSLNILAAGQRELALRFATRGEQHFDGLDVGISPGGLPRIRGALAHFECRRGSVYDGGDHSIVTGTVEWAATDDGAPLCYFRSGYPELAQ